jgi:hypothetical protein
MACPITTSIANSGGRFTDLLNGVLQSAPKHVISIEIFATASGNKSNRLASSLQHVHHADAIV